MARRSEAFDILAADHFGRQFFSRAILELANKAATTKTSRKYGTCCLCQRFRSRICIWIRSDCQSMKKAENALQLRQLYLPFLSLICTINCHEIVSLASDNSNSNSNN